MTKPALPRRSTRIYAENGLAGCVSRRKSKATGFLVGVYNCAQSGMEADPATPWATVCEEHNTICVHTSLALARDHASDPEGWCEACRMGYMRNVILSRYVKMGENGTRLLVAEKKDATLFETDADLVKLLTRIEPGKMIENVTEIAGYPINQYKFSRLTGDEVEELNKHRNGVGREA